MSGHARYTPSKPDSLSPETTLVGDPNEDKTILQSCSLPQYGPSTLVNRVGKLILLLMRINDATEPQEHVQRLLIQVKDLDLVSHPLQERAERLRFDGSPSGPVSSWAAVDYHSLAESVTSVSSICANGVIHRLIVAFSSSQDALFPDLSLKTPQENFFLEILTLQLQADTLILLNRVFTLIDTADRAKTTNKFKDRKETRHKASDLLKRVDSLSSRLVTADRQHDMGLDETHQAIREVRSIMQHVSTVVPYNEHFCPGHPFERSKLYTGRDKQIRKIQDVFSSSETWPSSDNAEASRVTRFIIQGMPGVGKTELALRYAEKTRQQYWGVFWIDASSPARIEDGYAEIAKAGEVNRNKEEAKYWLSNCPESWLLIIDNADDYETLDALLPLSLGQGRVLVTTRNPLHGAETDARTATLELDIMETSEAQLLFLRHAHRPLPQPPSISKLADDICRRLYFLPLALVQAGRAVWKNLVTLKEYISHFEGQGRRINKQRRSRKRRRDHSSGDILDRELCPLAAYEILHQSLVGATRERRNQHYKDALELLHILSYLHCRNVRFDMLVQAAVLPLREKAVADDMQRNEIQLMNKLHVETPSLPLTDQLRKLALYVKQQFMPATIAVLPDFLKNPGNLPVTRLEQHVRLRLRAALSVLVVRGLVQNAPMRSSRSDDGHIDDIEEGEQLEPDDYSDNASSADSYYSETEMETHRYYMHPLVHEWVRRRPQQPDEDSLGHDALVCQKAKSILVRVIPFQGFDSAHDMEMRRDLRPHIDAVRKHDHNLQTLFENNRQSPGSGRPWRIFVATAFSSVLSPIRTVPTASPALSRIQALEHGKYGLVYLEVGLYSEANELFERVERFTEENLGIDHEFTHRVKLARARTLYELTRWNDAGSLLTQVWESQKRILGENHPTTLSCALKVADSILTQGRLTKSLKLCEDTHERMVAVYGREDHLEPLKCLVQIARAHSTFLRFETAIKLFQQALDGMESRYQEPTRADEVINDASLGSYSTSGTNGDKENETAIEDPKDIPSESDVLSLRAELARELLKNKSHKEAPMRFARAEEMLREVVERRAKLSGKDHLMTLMARAFLGLAIATGENGRRAREAVAEYMEPARVIGERNLGKDHLALLAGKGWYADVLVLQHNYQKDCERRKTESARKNNDGEETTTSEEHSSIEDGPLAKAEKLLREASDKSKYAKASGKDGYHRDLIWHEFQLAHVLVLQGKKREALALNKELLDCLPKVGGHGLGAKHPISEKLTERIAELEEELDQASTATNRKD